ncbi:MAG: trypsin-like peptidase domain-containing protein [Pseudomonadota bacterium]
MLLLKNNWPKSWVFFILICLTVHGTFFSLCPAGQAETDSRRETPVVLAVKRVSPAVVNISSEFEVRARSNPFSAHPMNPLFDSFFKDFFDREQEQKYKRSSLGSGVIIDGSRGFVLTNAHVLAETGTVRVILMDEREFEAQIVGADSDSDLAVLRIDSNTPLPSIEMGDSDNLMIGETVIAIGNPFGFSNTVTTGVISALNRSIRAENTEYHDFIQTDASINPGNSGGPLLNINGELIGINTAIYEKARGIGFAIPINKARRIVSDLITHGEVIPSWIGTTVQALDSRITHYLQLPDITGVLVRTVANESPAKTAGIVEGDIILSLGKRKVISPGDFQAALREYANGEMIPVRLWRKGIEKTLSVRAAVFPMVQAMELAYTLLGIRVENRKTGGAFSRGGNASEGVIISELLSSSYLARIGARPGDIIRKIDDIATNTVEDFKKAVVRYQQKPSLVILLQRDDYLYHITVKL